MKVADSWLRHCYDQRSKFAKNLFLTVRLPLLSESVLKKVLGRSYNTRNSTVFQSNEECLEMTKKILENKEKFYQDRPTLSYKTRYCSQKQINVMVCGGINQLEEEYGANSGFVITKVDGEKFDNLEILPEISGCKYFWSVNVMCELYVLAKCKRMNEINLHKYSHEKNAWVKVKFICTSRDAFSVCSFMNKIYIVGGHYKNEIALRTCLEIDTASCNEKLIKSMKDARILAGCVAFLGKVVVSGGNVDVYDHLNNLNTVEAYCNVEKTWSVMPKMVHARNNHILVAVKKKLFVFGGWRDTCEIFDVSSNKFTVLKKMETLRMDEYSVNDAISVGGKVFVFLSYSAKVAVYDLDRNVWTEEEFGATKDNDCYTCVKLPKF